MDPSTEPPYINRWGRQVLRPPISCKGVKLHSFLFDADRDVLQKACDRYLNAPAQGRVRYVPLIGSVVLVCAQTSRLSATNPPDSRMGYMEEVDIAFWIPVAAVDPSGMLGIPKYIGWFIPYIFVDNPVALTTGREVYGYPKEHGVFQLPTSLTQPDAFRIQTWVFDTFSPDTKERLLPLFEVVRLDPPGPDPVTNAWHTLEDGFFSLKEALFGSASLLSIPGLELAFELFEYMRGDAITTIFLKQFRSVSDPDLACFQRIVEAPARLTGFRTGGALIGDYELTIHPYDSHQIALDLGLPGEAVRAKAAWYVDFDFDLELGKTV